MTDSDRMNRRSFVARTLGATALGALSAPFVAKTGFGQSRELVYAGRGGSLGTVWRNRIIKPFEEKFNCKVTYVTDDSVPALAKIVAQRGNPQVDVLWTTDQTHAQGVVQGVLDKIDFSRVPNAAECHDFAKFSDGIGILWAVGANVIGYNSRNYAEKGIPDPKSWLDVFHPGLAGHAGWFDLSTLQGTNSFLMVNKINGGSETNIDPGFQYLKKNISQFFAVVTSPAQMDDLFRQGHVWAAPNLDSRFLLLAKQNFPVKIADAREGNPQVSVILELVKGAPHPDLAYEFINWSLSRDMQQIIANEMELGPVNKFTQVDPQVAPRIIYGDAKIKSLVRFDYTDISKNLDSWIQRWNKELTR